MGCHLSYRQPLGILACSVHLPEGGEGGVGSCLSVDKFELLNVILVCVMVASSGIRRNSLFPERER